MPKERIYISVPIHGNKNHREQAQRVYDKLKKAGFAPVNPVLISDRLRAKQPNVKEEYQFLLHDLQIMTKCDGIFFCNGWAGSHGCRTELEFAWFLKRSKPEFAFIEIIGD